MVLGYCDDLEPSSGLYSTCIQAHSAANRVEHLRSKGAKGSAVSMAEASLTQAIEQYGLLGGVGPVPGL